MSTRKAVPERPVGSEDKERGLTVMERQAIQRSWDLMSRLLPSAGDAVGSGATPRKWVKGQVPCGLLGQRPDPSESLPEC